MANFSKFYEKMIEKVSKRKLHFFIRLSLVGILVLTILTYFLTPFSKVNNYELEGTYFYQKNEVLSIASLNKSTYLFNIDEKRSERLLSEHPLLDNAQLSINPFKLKINVKEIAPIFKTNENVYMNNFNTSNKYNTLDNSLLGNDLVKDKLENEISLVPYLLNETVINNDENKTILSCFSSLSLAICGYNNEAIDYLDFRFHEDALNGDFYLYFPINDNIKNKFFNNQEGNLVFILDAASVNFHIVKTHDNLKSLATYIIRFLHELLNGDISKQNINEATLVKEEIKGKEILTRSFYLFTKDGKFQIEAKK